MPQKYNGGWSFAPNTKKFPSPMDSLKNATPKKKKKTTYKKSTGINMDPNRNKNKFPTPMGVLNQYANDKKYGVQQSEIKRRVSQDVKDSINKQIAYKKEQERKKRESAIKEAEEKLSKSKDRRERAGLRRQIFELKYNLSEYDKKLGWEDQEKIRWAKKLYDEAAKMEEQGFKEEADYARKIAHEDAEIVRASGGYSGGDDGDQYNLPDINTDEFLYMTEEGKKAMRATKRFLEMSKEAGFEDAAKAAEEAMMNLRMTGSLWDQEKIRQKKKETLLPQNYDAHGRPLPRMNELQAEGIKNFFPAIKDEMLGSFLSLIDTGGKITQNAIRNRNSNAYQSNKRNAEYWEREARKAKTEEERKRFENLAKEARKAAEYAKYDEPVSENSPGNIYLKRAERERKAVLDSADNKFEKLLTQAAMSGIQMAPSLALGALTGGVGAAALMGAQAAGSKMGELSRKGESAERAFARGLVSGGIEAITEKIPVSNLFNIVKNGGGASFIKNIAKQSGIEATEESASYALNYLADKVAKDPNSKFSLGELVDSAAVGAISGAGFGGIGSALGKVSTKRQTNEKASNDLQESRNSIVSVFKKEKPSFPKNAKDESAVSIPNVISDPPVDIQQKAEQQKEQSISEKISSFNERYRAVKDRFDLIRNDPSSYTREDYVSVANDMREIMEESDVLQKEIRISRKEVSPKFMEEENHIDKRDNSSVSQRSVKAFQFDHPELRKYYAEAAKALIDDVNYSIETQHSEYGKGTVSVQSEALSDAVSIGLTKPEIIKVCNDIIADNGQENYAAAKMVEIILDGMLSNGYVPGRAVLTNEERVPPNEEYIAAKEEIPGSVKRDSFEYYKNRNRLALESGEITEEELLSEFNENNLPEGQGAMSAGGAGEFASWQAATPGSQFHSINEPVAQRTAEELGRAPIEVPKTDPRGMLTSKTVSTIMNAGITPNEFIEQLEESVVNGDFSRIAYSDEAARNNAYAKIDSIGFQRAKEQWMADVERGVISKDNTALGIALYQKAAEAGDAITALDIASKMASESTTAARALQARNIINKLTPSGQLYVITRNAENFQSKVNERERIRSALNDNDVNDAVSIMNEERYNAASDIKGMIENPYSNSNISSSLKGNLTHFYKNDINRVMRDIGVRMSNIIKTGAKDKEALAKNISDALVNEYGISADNAELIASDITNQFNDMVTDASRKRLESIFSKKPAKKRKTVMQKFEELGNMGAFYSDRFNSLATEKLFGYTDVKVDPELAKQFLDAETPEQRKNIEEEIYKDIAAQVPATWKDKFDAWRYLAMLGNMRSHIRNMGGGAGFMPVRMTKNVVAASLESALGVKDRTKAVINPFSKEDMALVQAAWKDFPNVIDTVKAGGQFDNFASKIDENRTIFKTKPLEFARKKNTELLDREDMLFSQPAYAGALAGYLKANNISASDFMSGNISEEAKAKAQEYAVKEAQRATFRDSNEFSRFVSSLGRVRETDGTPKKVARYFVEGLLPFKKTPANIAATAVRYSPIELMKGLTYDVNKVRNGDMSAAEAIDNVSAGLTGTGLVALGVFLASQGLVSGSGSGDDKQDQFDSLNGQQRYSLNIGDKSFTIDWLAPEALPFFVGVELFNSVTDDSKENTSPLDDALSMLATIANPMLEMSMMQSLNDAIENIKFSEKGIDAIAANIVMSYLGQFLPTIGGQLERTLEDKRQTTFIDRNSPIPDSIQKILGKWSQKIPGIDLFQQDYVDAWGNPQYTGNIFERAFNNFLNPSYVSDIKSGPLETELQRLYDLGYDNVFPKSPGYSDKIDGKYMTGDQYLANATRKGQDSRSMLESIVNSQEYKNMSDSEKAAIIKKVYEFGSYSGREAGGADTSKFDSWYFNLQEGRDKYDISPAEYLSKHLKKNEISKNDDMTNTQKGYTVAAMIDSDPNLNEEQKKYLKEKFKVFNMFPVDTGEDSKYQQAINAGFSPEEAAEGYEIIAEAKKYGDDSTLDESEFERYMRENKGIEKGTPEYNKYLKAYGSKNWKSVKALLGDSGSKDSGGYKQSDERYSSAINQGFDEDTAKKMSVGRQAADAEFGNGNGSLSKNELISYINKNFPKEQRRKAFSVLANKNWKNPY